VVESGWGIKIQHPTFEYARYKPFLHFSQNTPTNENGPQALFPRDHWEFLEFQPLPPSMTDLLLYDSRSCIASCSVAPELVGSTSFALLTGKKSTRPLQTPPPSSSFPRRSRSSNLESSKSSKPSQQTPPDGERSKLDEIALTRAALILG
jgi:hypothetical protein